MNMIGWIAACLVCLAVGFLLGGAIMARKLRFFKGKDGRIMERVCIASVPLEPCFAGLKGQFEVWQAGDEVEWKLVGANAMALRHIKALGIANPLNRGELIFPKDARAFAAALAITKAWLEEPNVGSQVTRRK